MSVIRARPPAITPQHSLLILIFKTLGIPPNYAIRWECPSIPYGGQAISILDKVAKVGGLSESTKCSLRLFREHIFAYFCPTNSSLRLRENGRFLVVIVQFYIRLFNVSNCWLWKFFQCMTTFVENSPKAFQKRVNCERVKIWIRNVFNSVFWGFHFWRSPNLLAPTTSGTLHCFLK